MANGNVIFTHKNYADDATLVSPYEVATLPATRLQSIQVSEKWRTQGVTNGLAWITGGIAEDTIPGVIALVKHNLTQSATWCVGTYSDVNLTNNGTFGSGTYWDYATGGPPGTSWAIGSGVATGTQIVSGFQLFQTSGGSSMRMAGKHLVKITIAGWTVVSGSPTLRIHFGTTSPASSDKYLTLTPSANGTYLLFVDFDVASGSWLGTSDGDYNSVCLMTIDVSTGTASFTLDNIETYEILQCNANSDETFPSAYPELQIYGALPWGAFSWDGSVSEADRATMSIMSYWHIDVDDVTRTPANAGFFLIIHDSTNADGYIEAGRLLVSSYFQFEANPEAGSLEVGWTDPSIIEKTDGGQTFITEKDSYRTLNFQFREVSESQAFGWSQAMQFVKGIKKDLLCIVDPHNDDSQQILSIYGRQPKMDKLKRPHEAGTGAVNDRAGIWTVRFEIEEML